MNFIASPPPSWTSRSCRPRQDYQAAEIESRDGYARRARSSAAMRRYGSEPSSAVRASTDSSALSIARRSEAGSEARRRTHASATSKAPSRQPRPRSTSSRASEERAGSRAVTGGQLRVRERREDARLVPQRGAPITSERERPLEHTRGRGEVAVRELRSAEKRRGLQPREHASALFRE